MSRRLKVSSAQLGPIHRADSRASVVKRMVEMLKEADSRGSKFVVFPELALTTFFPRYWMDDPNEVEKYFENQMPSPETAPLFELARAKGIGFYLGYAERTEEGGTPHHFNTSILVGPDGRLIGKYRKVHLPGHDDHRPNVPYQHLEKKYFEVGNLGWDVWRMFEQDVIVGQCICNDRRWPETFRVMGLKGAEMVVLGYNTPSDNVYAPHEPPYLRVFHHNLSLQAAAYQNGIWVVATAKAGKEDGFWLHGGSVIVAPTGEIVAKGTTEEDEVISYDCDLALGEYIRNTTFNFAKHRRPEHYKLISERAGVKLEPSN
ncbi:N-carbamoyl-D-amino-acid hydrolase [soil metagenome]